MFVEAVDVALGADGNLQVLAVVGLVERVIGGDVVVHRAGMDDADQSPLRVIGVGDGSGTDPAEMSFLVSRTPLRWG